MICSITHNPQYIFLKRAAIPTYYGISIAIPKYIAMQLPPLRFYDTHHHCHIALHDHVVDMYERIMKGGFATNTMSTT